MFIRTFLRNPLCRIICTLALGAATVSTTMHLVNTKENIKLLADLDLQKKPEIPEPKILPKQPPQQKTQTPPEPSGGENTKQDQNQPPAPPPPPPPTPTPTDTEDTKVNENQEASGSQETDLIQLIRMKAKEIHDSNWLETTEELGTIYSIITSVTQLHSAVEQYQQSLQQNQAQEQQ